MSLNYAASLSPYANKGKCGQPETEETKESVEKKCETLFNLITQSKHIVVLTGAGISTSCGIPDFRGPKGVWTLEKKGKQPEMSISFEDSQPSYAHYALSQLVTLGKLHFLISQNIDGLHMKSGFPLNRLAELHGNMFIEKCNTCNTKYINSKCVNTIGLKPTDNKCTKVKAKGNCRGILLDTILDWDDALPQEDMSKSELNCKQADLCICLGTSLQIMPVGNYPLLTKKNNGKIVIVNLQPTRIDNKADLIINAKIDLVFQILFDKHFKTELLKQTNSLDLKIEIKNKLTLHYSFTDCSSNNKKVIKKMLEPHLILLLSGKRKSGKDYVTNKLIDCLQNEFESFNTSVVTLSAPLKELYAQEHQLDYGRLLDSSGYKEQYRLDMIKWSDLKRDQDPFIFCRKAVEQAQLKLLDTKFNVWIVSDIRRKTDLRFFQELYPNQVKTVRVIADESTRVRRNWIFTNGVDDSKSECDLDSVCKWDFEIINNDDSQMNKTMQILIDYLKQLYKINF